MNSLVVRGVVVFKRSIESELSLIFVLVPLRDAMPKLFPWNQVDSKSFGHTVI